MNKRHLDLPGSYNIRDVGGYVTKNSTAIRWQTLLRSGKLNALTSDSQQSLLDYGLKTVIDCRSTIEREQAPGVFEAHPDVAYHHLPVFDDDRIWQALLKVKSHEEGYILLLEECQDSFRSILETIAQQERCTLIHCSLGKDRTGLVTALLLGLAGVPVETLAEDYSLTIAILADVIQERRQQAILAGENIEVFDMIHASEPQTMANVLAYLQESYGGITEYVRAIGVQPNQITDLRHWLLES